MKQFFNSNSFDDQKKKGRFSFKIVTVFMSRFSGRPNRDNKKVITKGHHLRDNKKIIRNAYGEGEFSTPVQKSGPKVLKTWYFPYSACQWGRQQPLPPAPLATPRAVTNSSSFSTFFVIVFSWMHFYHLTIFHLLLVTKLVLKSFFKSCTFAVNAAC